MKGASGKAIYRNEYKPYPWDLEQVQLKFDIDRSRTVVSSVLTFNRKQRGDAAADIELDGSNMSLISIALNGQPLNTEQYRCSNEQLVILDAPDHSQLEIEVEIDPSSNTALEGLYPSGEFLLTQCEAEGFRKITYFPDRPDVMSRFDVTLTADRDHYPVLLSNGNNVESGVLDGNRHFARWEDPFAKPAYLFALVAGDLACIRDNFVTRSGRDVDLRIYVEHENIDRCDHAMESLIQSMRWDEERFNLEYDLDIYNIVATNDFNMGAMENKSLNIFNSKYVLARPDTATDMDYQGIQGVIGHEYFHNWTGNRVTCQDWFQLTLKEGLTVFRDQEFSSDMLSRPVKRIQDVRILRSRQFPEDAGAMSHSIRPDKFHEISNFYTMTVYQKGSEIIRMYHTLLGEAGFQAGMKLYFERHDGQAVTCDDFLAAMADANDRDLTAFSRWYSQSGTPVVTAFGSYCADSQTYTLTLEQFTPPTHDQREKQALVIPVKMGLISDSGAALPLEVRGEDGPASESRVLLLTEDRQSWVFENIAVEAVPSLLRGFSAPVKLRCDYSDADLALLMAHDSDEFTRWEAAQILAQREILTNVQRLTEGKPAVASFALLTAYRLLLADKQADPALVAETLTLPGEDYLAEQMERVDVEGIHQARQFVKANIASKLQPQLMDTYQAMTSEEYDKSADSMGRRSLRNVCLSYLMETDAGPELAHMQFKSSDNMTDTLAALRALVWSNVQGAESALAAFEAEWKADPLVMDKWFSIQSSVPGPATVQRVEKLIEHPGFSIRNPNKVRSVIGVFSGMNPTGFHAANGEGYRLLADQVIELDALNPQVAARMVSAFNQWVRYDQGRQDLMRQALQRIAAIDGLSADVSEIVNSAIGMEAA